MTVARDVKNIDGMLLAPSGCQLSERQINILQAWGVTGKGGNRKAGEENRRRPRSAGQIAAQERAGQNDVSTLRARFWKPDDFGPVPAEIFKFMLLRQARRASTP